MARFHWQLLTLFAAVTFVFTAQFSTHSRDLSSLPQITDRVVISPPVQLLLYGGDRFLAADLEIIRLLGSASSGSDSDNAHYLSRALQSAAQLNPCHEDNYYFGNAILSWGGAVDEGSDLLRRATECRFWDWQPPYFQGINQYFFLRNGDEAQRAMNIAAERSTEYAAALRKTAIMIATSQIDDDQMALTYLKHQRDQASDTKLRELLDERVGRLEGLIVLRQAQKRFEQQTGRPLASAEELISSGQLEQFPVDPLGIGYTYKDGQFVFRRLRINGTEGP